MSESLPFWFTQALETESESAQVRVGDTAIHYVTWGRIGNPGVVLIHGSNAHLEWWRFLAPFLADRFRVAALDLSGNGDSQWREKYTGKGFADEVMAVCEAAQLGSQPMIVGHSFGGFVALETGHYYGGELGGILFMDFTVAPPEQANEWGLRVAREGVQPRRRLRVYPTKEEALGRFRLLPEQPGVHPTLLEHMAEYGLREAPGGWTWKFDPGLFDYLEMGTDQQDKFLNIDCPMALMLGERSEDEAALFGDHMLTLTDHSLPVVTIPGTYHHLMFDQPVAVAMATKMLLLEWRRQLA